VHKRWRDSLVRAAIEPTTHADFDRRPENMRTALIVVAGIVLLTVFAIVGWRIGGGPGSVATAAKLFIPVWLAAALINMWFGVSRAGYSVTEEFPIFLLIFAIPAAIGAFVWWRFS
jgi:hypothetical protein